MTCIERVGFVMRFVVSTFTLITVLAASAAQPADGPPGEAPSGPRPDLTGVVKDQQGKPLGDASVFIYTAGPREGIGILCPSCYADCRKHTTTDAQGRFKIESLDPALLFRVLVVAKGKKPEFATKVDPAAKPLEVTLPPAQQGLKPNQQVKGRIINTERKPISGAVVNIRGVVYGPTTRYGGNEELDQIAVSDDDGLFTINSSKPFEAVGLDIEARGYAKGIFPPLATGGKVHELKLTEGATVKGRLVREGKPLAGVEVGISGAEREAGAYVGDFSVATDKDGKFFFVNLPPKRDYFLYGRMSSLGEKGAVAAIRQRVGDDGSELDAGDVNVTAGFKLAGRVHLSDGKPVPPKTRVLLSRDEAWDSVQTETGADGAFSFVGVPPETIELSARVKGYRLSERNRSLDLMNRFGLVGILKADKTDMVIELEPGEHRSDSSGNYVDIRQEPLLGAEAAREHKGDIHVTGTIVDAETKAPIAAFTVTEGRAANYPNSVQWMENRRTDGTNGQLDIFLNQGRNLPAILIEAEGYFPESSGPISGTETNFSFALKKGFGPAGTVLKPDGTPAAGTTVYLADMQNGVYVQDNDMKVQSRVYQGTRNTLTDDQGKFSFKARADDYGLLVLEDAGFAEVTVEQLRENPNVQLKPWGKVQGKLMIGTRPGTNEEIRLGQAFLPYQYHPRNFSPLSLFLRTQTDDKGEFSFNRVPPINVQVYHSPKVKDDKMGTVPTSQTTSFTLQPAETKNITLGGQGRPVIGKMVVKGYDGTINWRSDAYTIETILPPTEDLPDMVSLSREWSGKIQAAEDDDEKKRLIEQMRKTQEANAAKQRAFYASEKGRAYYFQSKRYCLNFAEDGSFRIEDVHGGKYRLRMDLREGGGGAMRFNQPSIAFVEKELQIPDSPGGRTDEPFDVGTIEMQARNALKVSSKAPDFEVKTVDDKPLKLADFTGKYVLLDFWAVWCGPCVAETPHLKATYDAFKDDDRFRMVGLSLDPISKTPREYARKNKIEWTMGFLGDWSKSDLPNRYGVEGIPSIFLIGPDGKIIARDLRGPGIKSAVERALSQSATAKAGTK